MNLQYGLPENICYDKQGKSLLEKSALIYGALSFIYRFKVASILNKKIGVANVN